MSSRTCPDWPMLMEIAPELQFMHYTVAEAQLPVDVLTTITHVSLGDVAICCDLAATSSTPRTPTRRSPRHCASTHWFEVARVRARTPDTAA